MKNVLITGANGQLGTHLRILAPTLANRYFFTDVDELDITSREAVDEYVRSHGIDVVVNCAAYTNVDKAESDEATAERINAEAVGYLADAMERVGGGLLHVSTDYVFGGNMNNTPCRETEEGNPTGAYGRTKWAGEAAAKRCRRHVIVRTSWLYSEYGKNFLLTMLNLTSTRPEVKVVFDQVGTPTYAGDLAKALAHIVESEGYIGHPGLYHFANEGVCSWYDFAYEIARRAGHTACRVTPCHSNEFPSPVKRPSYSVLDKTKIKETFGIAIPHWTESLQICLNNIHKQ